METNVTQWISMTLNQSTGGEKQGTFWTSRQIVFISTKQKQQMCDPNARCGCFHTRATNKTNC